MALSAALDQESYEALDEVLQGEYAEQGGRWVLQVDGIKEHPTVSGLQKAYEAEKRRANERAEKLKAFGDLTPDDVQTLQSEIAELREKKDDGLISPEELQALKEKQKDLARRAKEADEMEKDLDFFRSDQQERLKSEIRGKLAESGAKSEAVPAAAALIQSEYNARFERGDKSFQPVVTGELEGVPGDHGLGEFVDGWLKGPGAWAMPPTGKGGSGADPNQPAKAPESRSGVKHLRMEGTTVRANPEDILSGKAAVVQEA